MAYLAIPLLFVALVAGYGYLRFTSARARERAGLPARVRVKLPLYLPRHALQFGNVGRLIKTAPGRPNARPRAISGTDVPRLRRACRFYFVIGK
jgi:hypothetical protein